MSIFKIAWRSIQHRGFGSFLTMLSMALGVMMVVTVLSVHGIVSKSFKNNNSFGYNIIVGARGGSMQLTMNTVYYLSKPVENIPYEYYLAFCDKETRRREMQNSIAMKALKHEMDSLSSFPGIAPAGIGSGLLNELTLASFEETGESIMRTRREGHFKPYAHIAIPICLGDYWEVPDSDLNFRCVGTKPEFFSELLLDLDTEETFEFSEGRCFQDWNLDDPVIGPHECVVGAAVAKRGGVKLGDHIYPTHGDPNSSGAHIHNTPFTVVGIVAATGTPHDRVVFLNMEGFFLMEGHVNPVEDDGILKDAGDDEPDLSRRDSGDEDSDEVGDEDWGGDPDAPIEELDIDDNHPDDGIEELEIEDEPESQPESDDKHEISDEALSALNHVPLSIERREVTAILVRTSLKDKKGVLPIFLPNEINRDNLNQTLNWSSYRPMKAQTAAQGVNPIEEVSRLFSVFVDPTRWALLGLTIMICIVSALSILVGIYNSMSQRQHEIAVMRALGASRGRVMSIMFVESVLLACFGGVAGWITGHGLNAALGPTVESRTGVSIGFLDFAPAHPLASYFGSINLGLPEFLAKLPVSPEMLLIPGLIILAVVVGIYPAISAYKTDVADSLGA